MLKNLETYLREIDQYLAVKQGGDEIIAEIRSHILERAEGEAGSVTEESVQRIIDSYGNPREVAEKYIEGTEIITPAFRKYLFRYTWILFVFNAALVALALWQDISILMIPFFLIPRMTPLIALAFLPMAWLADFGLVAFVLYIITQKNRNLRLPWLGLFREPEGSAGLRPPRPAAFVLLLAVFSALIFLFARYRTLFFYSIDLNRPESLLEPAASIFLSMMVLAALLFEVVGYGARFFVNSRLVRAVKNASILAIFWAIFSSPVEITFAQVPGGIDLGFLFGLILVLIMVVKAFKMIRDLVFAVRGASVY